MHFVNPILLLALFFNPPEKCILSGNVVNGVTGEPLNKTEVVAEPIGGGNSVAASTTTDAQGSFTLIDLDAGQYRLVARRNGYLDTYYGARRASKPGTAITLEAGQELKGLQIKAQPFAVIAGTVRDPDGEPLANVSVGLYRWEYERGRRRISGVGEDEVITDDQGQYRVTGLAPGKYYVRVRQSSHNGMREADHSAKSGHPPEALIPTFYPGVSDPAAASLVEVTAGARVTGIDIVLMRSPLFHLTVHAETPAGLDAGASLEYSIPGFEGIGQPSKNKRDIEIGGVPPGSYLLIVSASEPSKAFTGVVDFNDEGRYRTRVPVQVAGADVEGVRVVVAAGAEIAGHVSAEGGKPLQLAGHNIVFSDGAQLNVGNIFIQADNVFATRLSVGRYVVEVDTGDADWFVKSIRSEDKDILRDGLTVSGPGRIPIEIVLSSDGGQVEGVVFDKDDKTVPGAAVVLVPPPTLRESPDFFKSFTADQNGHFRFKAIAPGDYKLFAWDDVEDGAWLDPDFLKDFEAQGEPVTVEVKGQPTAKVHLSSIAKQ